MNGVSKNLIKFSKNINNVTHHKLILKENFLASKFFYNNCLGFREYEQAYKKYIRYTSIPFCFKNLNIDLKDLWDVDCSKCSSVVDLKVFPTGNLNPDIFVVGEAPSALGDYSVYGNSFGRAWVHGRTSNLIREALSFLKVHHLSWYTNILKCPIPGNKEISKEAIDNCYFYFKKELSILKPKIALILGKAAKKVWDYWGFKTKAYFVYHPAYYARLRKSSKNYAKHIYNAVKG